MPRHLPCVRPINTLAIVICNHYHCPCFVRIDSIRFSRSPRARWPAALPGVSPVRREEVYYASPSTVSTADFEELSGSPRGPPRCAAPRGAGCILYANPGAGARGDPEVFQKKGAPGGRRRGKPSLPARGMGRDRVPPLRGAGARRRWRKAVVARGGGADSVWRLRGARRPSGGGARRPCCREGHGEGQGPSPTGCRRPFGAGATSRLGTAGAGVGRVRPLRNKAQSQAVRRWRGGPTVGSKGGAKILRTICRSENREIAAYRPETAVA